MRAASGVVIFLAVIASTTWASDAPSKTQQDFSMFQGSFTGPDAVPVDTVANTGPGKTEVAADKSRTIRRKLRLAAISSVSVLHDPNTRNDLAEYVRQVDALRFPDVKPAKVEITDATDTRQSKTVVEMPDSPPIKTKPPDPNMIVTGAQERQDVRNRKIAALLETPDKVFHPLAVADALYAGKDFKNAARFYQLALERMSREKEQPHRSWALFQTANSLRSHDTTAAIEFYGQLIAEFPNSHWAPAAKVQQSIITWSAAEKTPELLEKYTRDPNSL